MSGLSLSKPRAVLLRHAVSQPRRVPGCGTATGTATSVHSRCLRGHAAVLNAPSTAGSECSDNFVTKDKAVLLQGFGWDSCKNAKWYEVVQAKIPDMQACGVTHLWLPPPSQSVSAQGYMPGQLWNLNSRYGSQEQLRQLVQELRAAGIAPVADIVINHRCADEMVDGVYNKFRDDVDHKGHRIDWGQWAITSNDPLFGGKGNPDTGEDYGPAPDLDHANPELRAALKDWLGWLQTDIGFAGWRLDFVKGYGARFVEEYIAATVGKDAFCVGEYWTDLQWEGSNLACNQDAARQKLCDWIDANKKSCTAFDFPTKGILQEACRHTQYNRLGDSKGKAPGLIGWWPSMAVTFIENHDTGSSQKHWPFPSDYVTTGYAYILTHPGIPCIFWEHMFDWGSQVRKSICELVELRKRNDITADSKLVIKAADSDLYVAVIDDRVTLKMGPRYDIGKLLPQDLRRLEDDHQRQGLRHLGTALRLWPASCGAVRCGGSKRAASRRGPHHSVPVLHPEEWS